jgi:hypothetical protein
MKEVHMANYATTEDLAAQWRTLTATEETRASVLLTDVSALLRIEADKVGKDLNEMVAADADYAAVAKMVTCDIVKRYMCQDNEAEAMTQYSQSALGYSISGTYSNAGKGLAGCIMNVDLKRLGLKRQRFGTLDPYAPRG